MGRRVGIDSIIFKTENAVGLENGPLHSGVVIPGRRSLSGLGAGSWVIFFS